MATTQIPLLITGFEHGRLGAPYTGTPVGTVAIEAASARSHDYGLRLSMSGTRSALQQAIDGDTGVYHVVGRFYVMFRTFPTTNYGLLYHFTGALPVPFGFEFNASTNRIRPHLRYEWSDTDYLGEDCDLALEEGVWYRIEYRSVQTSSTSRTIDWGIAVEDGALVQQSQLSVSGLASTGSYVTVVQFGELQDRGNTTTGEICFDDVAIFGWQSGSVPDYPTIGPGRVVLLGPTADGTHNNAAHFTDDAGNSPPASVYDRVDEIPPGTGAATDYVYQNTASSTSYLEVSFGDLPALIPASTVINGAIHRLGYHVPTSGTSGPTYARIHDNLSGQALSNANTGNAVLAGKRVSRARLLPYQADTANWTKATIEALLGRIGFSTDVDPVVRIDDWHLEVDYPYAAAGQTKAGWGILA